MSNSNDKFWQSLYGNVNSHWNDRSYSSNSYGTWSYGYDLDYNKPKRRHKFSPILLIFSTVYNCEHCGAKKEDCKTDYCDEYKEPEYDTGGW